MGTETKTPFVRLAKRAEMAPRKIWLIRISSIIIALILGCIPIILT